MRHRTSAWARTTLLLVATLGLIVIEGCGASQRTPTTPPHTTPPAGHTTATTTTSTLPGTGRPTITIGDKNFTEQFILGELYYEALKAQGFSVQLNQNIGPLEVTMQDLRSGQLAMYPEYLDTWNAQVAHQTGPFPSQHAAYQVGQTYAKAHGFRLLDPTPFSDTPAIGTTFKYAVQKGLTTIGDLRNIGHRITLGGPPQFQQAADGLPAIESSYGVVPAAYKTLEIGAQYQALDSGAVQAADVNTTDGSLSTGDYTLLRDPLRLFGWGNVVPVVSTHAIAMEGPAFATTVNEVSSLLTTDVIRELNAQVDLSGRDPATVAGEFLAENGLG